MTFTVALPLLLIWLLLTGCSLGAETPAPAPTISASVPDSTITESPTPASDGWHNVQPGMDQRSLIPDGDALAQIDVFRIDPALFRFEAHYRPGAPLRTADWAAALPDAALIVNANFFDPDYNVVGLLISFGETYGYSYTDRGGLFAVIEGVPTVRSNIYEPYQYGEQIDHAVQAFPMLVLDGAQAYTFADDGNTRRRTVIGMDASGQVLIMATPLSGMTLTEISAFLAESDLNLVDAFALDGGGSTFLIASAADYSLPSFDAVPAVLAVFAG